MNPESLLKLSYGVYIIAAQSDGKSSAYLGNTAFQITAEPPQIAISSHKDNVTTSLIEKSGFFSLSVLKENASLSTIGILGYQHGDETNKLSKLNHFFSSNKTPIILEDSLAWFECKIVQKIDVGTHYLFIGEIIEQELIDSKAAALTYHYYRNDLKAFASENAPTYIDPHLLKSHSELFKSQDSLNNPNRNLQSFRCMMCEYVYDPAKGDPSANIPPGTPFEELPDDWICPVCGVGKDMFDEV